MFFRTALGLMACLVATTALADDPTVVYLDQGWDDATREAFYYTTQGSRMLPYDWFVALEQADTRQRLASANNMRAMGFVVDEAPTMGNPDGLPVGFAMDVDADGQAHMGLTCAACHTGEVQYDAPPATPARSSTRAPRCASTVGSP
jgi:hypothetical protein